jgi:hypothetical protein
MYMSGFGGFVLLLVWVIGAAIAFGIIYFAVRLAVFHALKSHTLWMHSAPGGQAPPPTPPAPPAPPVPPVQHTPPAGPAPQAPQTPPTPPTYPLA